MQTSTAVKWAAVAAAIGLGLYAITRVTRAGEAVLDAAGDALWAVSPTNNNNVLYQTANRPVQWLTGDPDATLGTWAYDVTHDGTLNPASTNNIIYRNINPGGQSLGSWLYDKFN